MIRNVSFVLFAVLAFSCDSFFNEEVSGLCAPPVKGRIVGAHPSCAGMVVQVTGGQFLPSQVQASYTDSQGSTFANAFRLVGVCEMPEADGLRLAEAVQSGEEFLFYFADGNVEEDNCAYCKPYVLFPDVRSHITLSDGECNDTPE
jgi:hypothetical protein